jgi:hypothetical protein
VQVSKAALAALAIHAGLSLSPWAAPATAAIPSGPRAMTWQLEAPREGAPPATHSILESNRARLPLEEGPLARFTGEDTFNLDEAIPGGVLSSVRPPEDSPAHRTLMPLAFGVVEGDEESRFSMAGADLPEIGLDEDDIGPGDVVMVIGGMCAIGALIYRLHKGGHKLKPLSKRKKQKIEIMSDSDFYPI